ncbi:M48 family metallopeptidase [Pseudomonas sp. RIT-PI-S]|uniref:M48 family metallopeptidase n=1 Tax=Pseudomonas sp. RIT-PI-S TaxID=3035295 RepID=UPI003207D8E5
MKHLKLFAVLVLLPLCLGALGAWQLQRGIDDNQERAATLAYLQSILPEIEALDAKPSAQFIDIDGVSVSTGIALSQIRETEHDLHTLQPIGASRVLLAKASIALGLLAAIVGAAGLFALGLAARQALRSRDQLLSAFVLVRKALPLVLVGHITALTAAAASAVIFEGLGVWHEGHMDAGEFKLMLCMFVAAFCLLYTIWELAKQLKVMLAMFEPTAMAVLGEAVTLEQAPALWAYVGGLAERLGAIKPTHIIVGMDGGFYVTSSDIELKPSGTLIQGCTLHVPIAYLGLLDTAETSAVIGHELGHFVGADTAYSLKFVPIHDGISRSLGVIADNMAYLDRLQRWLMQPAFMLGLYFMERFEHAVGHWSRVRELAADAAGAQLVSNAAAASALMRITAIDPLLEHCLASHRSRAANLAEGEAATPDLPTAVIKELAEKTLTLPSEEMAIRLPHPTDTHPSNGERLAALGVAADAVTSEATRPVGAVQAHAALQEYFADAAALQARLTEAYLGHYTSQDASIVAHLRDTAQAVTENVALHESGRIRGKIVLALSGLFTLPAIALPLLPTLSPQVADHAATFYGGGAVMAAIAAGAVLMAMRTLRRANVTALVLTPTQFIFANLKAPVPTDHIEDFSITLARGVFLTLLITKDAPLPELASRSFFAPNAVIDPKKRLVRLALMDFCRNDKTQGQRLGGVGRVLCQCCPGA